MARELTKADLDALIPKSADLRPMIAEQVWKIVASSDYKYPADTVLSKVERFLRSVEREGYAKKIRKRDERPSEDSAPYMAMLKNWGRKRSNAADPKLSEPEPKGDKEFARGVFYYLFRHIGKHSYFTEIAASIWPHNDPIFQRLYYAKYFDDPSSANFANVCARFNADIRIIRKEFNKIWIGLPVERSQKIHIGPLTVVLDEEDEPERLSLQESRNTNYLTDGMPDIFKALDWRSRLSGFHGRQQEAIRLLLWAQDEFRGLKVMLVSGPGGVGKTRLAAYVVEKLVHEHGWRGGFLGNTGRPLDGSGSGAAIIIDYPEERTSYVTEILKAAAHSLKNDEVLDQHVRIILVSRQNKESWTEIINDPTNFIEEIKLEARPYLDIEDALAIADDISIEYSERIGRISCRFHGLETWLKHEVHRLPLNIVAASVHAVLDPNHAFKLQDNNILAALSKMELRRIRYYSKRDFGEQKILEKLLGLSIITQSGLHKETIYELGNGGICFGKSGDGLLEAAINTPYWQPLTAEHAGHLIRIKPDRAAAALCLEALRLDDPSPGLSGWLVPTVRQDAKAFGDRLSRLAFDLGHINPTSSRNLENQLIKMLDIAPDLIWKLENIAYRHLQIFSSHFAIDLCNRLIACSPNPEHKAAILTNQALFFSNIEMSNLSLKAIEGAVAIYRGLAEAQPNMFLHDLAMSLNNQAYIFVKNGNKTKAIETYASAVEIYRRLASEQPKAFLPDLALALSSQTRALSDVQQYEAAVVSIEEAVTIRRQLSHEQPDIFLPNLAMSLNNLGINLCRINRRVGAIMAIDEAVRLYEELALDRPEDFLPDLAMSLTSQAFIHSYFGDGEAALKSINSAVEIRRPLARAWPENFSAELATSLNKQSAILLGLNRHRESLTVIEEAIDAIMQSGIKSSAIEEILEDCLKLYMHICNQALSEPNTNFLLSVSKFLEAKSM